MTPSTYENTGWHTDRCNFDLWVKHFTPAARNCTLLLLAFASVKKHSSLICHLCIPIGREERGGGDKEMQLTKKFVGCMWLFPCSRALYSKNAFFNLHNFLPTLPHVYGHQSPCSIPLKNLSVL